MPGPVLSTEHTKGTKMDEVLALHGVHVQGEEDRSVNQYTHVNTPFSVMRK